MAAPTAIALQRQRYSITDTLRNQIACIYCGKVGGAIWLPMSADARRNGGYARSVSDAIRRNVSTANFAAAIYNADAVCQSCASKKPRIEHAEPNVDLLNGREM